MSIIQLKPKTKRPDLMVNYLGKDYALPGNISAAMMEQMFKTQAEGGDEAFLKMFLAEVVPPDFKRALGADDIPELSKIWMEHIQGPKDSGSSK